MEEVQITHTVVRDSNVLQIEVISNDVTVRNGAANNKKVLGKADIGFYNCLNSKESSGTTWYEIAKDQWIANKEGLTILHPSGELESLLDVIETNEEIHNENEETDTSVDVPSIFDSLDVSEDNTIDVRTFVVGSIVRFKGGKHYMNSITDNGAWMKPSFAKIVDFDVDGKHKLKLEACDMKGNEFNGVHGWVDEDRVDSNLDITAKHSLKIGDAVRCKKSARSYCSGVRIPEHIKQSKLYIYSIESGVQIAVLSKCKNEYQFAGRFWISDIELY